MQAHALIAVALLASCDAARSEPAKSSSERAEDAMMLRFHMRQNLTSLRAIERLVIRGRLAEAKAMARALATAPDEPGMAPWRTHTARVRELARALAASPTTDEACRREARLAVACASCHQATALPDLEEMPPVPADRPTVEARMARHVWATDRLWEAAIGGGDDPWRAGLDVLAQTPLPYHTSQDDRAGLARKLQQLAVNARLEMKTDTLAQRGTRYGELLIVCASCHAAKPPAPLLPSLR